MRKQRLHENLNNASDLKKNVEKKFMRAYKRKKPHEKFRGFAGLQKIDYL